MDKDRRKFLKILLIGGGTLFLGKVLGPVSSKFLGDSLGKHALPPVKNQTSDPIKAFRVVENTKELSIFDHSGEEIFQIDKGT